MLDASQSTDPDGTIVSYQWQQIGGPNTVTSSTMNGAQVSIGGLDRDNMSSRLQLQIMLVQHLHLL